MSRQITLGRAELALPDLNLQDPDNGFYVGDGWKPGGTTWQKYTAAGSAWVDGDRVVGQRKLGSDEIFTIYLHAADQADLKTKLASITDALSQYRYTLYIEWDGLTFNFTGNGAGEVKISDTTLDPELLRNGWISLELTIPRDPGLG